MSTADLVQAIGQTARAVGIAVGPLAFCFIVFQLLFLKLPRREVVRIVTGAALASGGLFLFLLGMSIGFLPFGRALGEALGALPHKWALVPFGLVLGFVTTWGEPSVRILADQVEEASTGSIPHSLVVWAVSLGVAFAVGVGLFRAVHGLPLLYLLLPGYAIVIAIMTVSDPEYTGIAIDAGGVATGPLANTFLLALALGAASAAGSGQPLVEGLGLVSLIALAPVISVMVVGLIVRWRARQKESPS